MIYHGTFDLDYILRMDDELAGSMLRDGKTGQLLTSADVKTRAAILKAKGFEGTITVTPARAVTSRASREAHPEPSVNR